MGIPELTSEQVEKLCEVAEEAARKYVLSKVPLRNISDISVIIDIKGSKPITVTIDLEIVLSPQMKDFNVQKLTSKATEIAFLAVEECLSEMAWESKK